MAEVCEEPTLQQNDLGDVQVCGCGGINLTIGLMTLHLSQAELGLLFDLVCASRKMVVNADFMQNGHQTIKVKGRINKILH